MSQKPQQTPPDDSLARWISLFLRARQAERLVPGTIKYYEQKLTQWATYTEQQGINGVQQITPDHLREFLIHLESTKHSPGGIHSFYRSIKAFLRWYEDEVEPGWPGNPIKRVKAPRVDQENLPALDIKNLEKMVDTCDPSTFTGRRDRALFLFFLDTGVRTLEGLAIDIADVDLYSGEVVLQKTKARKPRTVYVEKKTRKALRIYINERTDQSDALWIGWEGERLSMWGLREIIHRRADAAGVPRPSARSFRRAFALTFLRNNPGDIYNLRKLMGHKGLSILQRYLDLTDQDARDAHRRGSPVDNSSL